MQLSVKLAPTSERETLVCGVANERMPEAESAGDLEVALDELAESVPRLGTGGYDRVTLEDVLDERAGKRHAEHGCPPK